MQMLNQLTTVDHIFEHKSEQEVNPVVSSPNRPITESLQLTDKATSQTTTVPENASAEEVTLSPKLQINQKIIELFARQANGLSIEPKQFGLKSLYAEKSTETEFKQAELNQAKPAGPAPTELSFTILTATQTVYEHERLDFQRHVQVIQNDGTQSELSLAFSYQRELQLKQEISFSVAQLKDPLILNLGQQSSLFSQDTQEFDLDGDGQKELIPVLSDNLWFLAYDRNNNGIIDNGLELFGAKTGDGFAELNAYDSNANGLLDYEDKDYKSFVLHHSQAEQQTLAQAGIKAISLDASHSPFSFKDNQGNTLAQMRKTSVYLNDKQQLGAIHQVDFVV
ncbi:hypothetical protein [Paraglaciecola aestuariivivens]